MAYENFTGYTEEDPNEKITVAANTVSWEELSRDEAAYVYKDFGADYFAGYFSINLAVYTDDHDVSGTGSVAAFALTNLVDDLRGIFVADGDYIAISHAAYIGGHYRITLIVINDGASGGSDNTAKYAIELDKTYYLTLIRNETVGDYGTLYLLIYSDSGRTDLIDTLTVTLQKKVDFRYLFAVVTQDDGGSQWHTGATMNLELTANVSVPTVVTLPVTGITNYDAIGNGNITDLGGGAASAHGVCWNTTGSPTVADNYTDEGAKESTGLFDSLMTDLAPGTKYYVKAYATNLGGTGYGDEKTFNTTPLELSEGVTYGGRAVYAGQYVLVDWDNDGDFVDSDEDITTDVIDIDINRGKDRELSKATAAFIVMTVKNGDHKYSPPNTSSALNTGSNALLPGRKVLVGMSYPWDEMDDSDAVTLANHAPDVPYDENTVWTEQSGTWIFDTNKVKETGGSGGIATIDFAEADAHVQVDFYKGANNDGIIVFRFQDDDNYMYVRTDGTNLDVRKVVATADSSVDTGAYPWTNGVKHTVKVILHGEFIYVLVDGAVKVSTSSDTFTDKTEHGIGGPSISGDARYNKFGGVWQLFYGTIDRIIPNPGIDQRTAYIECSDDFKIAARTTLRRTVYPYGGFPKDGGAFIKEIVINNLPNASQRGWILDIGLGAEVPDTGSHTAWWKRDALEVMHSVESDENGFLYQDPDGLWRFEAKGHRAAAPHDSSRCTIYGIRDTNGKFMTNLKWRSGAEDVVNRVTVTVRRSVRQNTANYYAELWRCAEADVLDGGIATSTLSIPASRWKVIYFEASAFDAISAVQDPLSSATEYKVEGTVTDGPFRVGENVTTDVSGEDGYVVEQSGGKLILGGCSGAFAAGDTLTGADSGATMNGGVTVTALPDYKANAAADGSGADATGDLTVALAAIDDSDVFNWGKGGKLTLTNGGGSTLYVTKLRVLGDSWKLQDPVSYYVHDSTSEGKYGESEHTVDCELFQTWDEAKVIGDDIEGKEDDPRAKVDVTLVNSTKQTLMQILARRISDRVTVNWSDMGVDEDFYINRTRYVITDGGMNIVCTWGLEEVA